MKKLISTLFFVLCIGLACWIGGWILFIQPIIAACQAFDNGILTATIVGITVIKCLCAAAVASLIVWIGSLPLQLMALAKAKKNHREFLKRF